ncbi:MAG: YtxH domain-containing protein [bacterium]
MSEERGNAPVILLAFLLGGVVGAGLALLFAPLSGRETRERIKDLVEEVKDKADGAVEEIRDKVKETLDLGKKALEEKKSMVSAAFEAGKEAMGKEKEKLTQK